MKSCNICFVIDLPGNTEQGELLLIRYLLIYIHLQIPNALAYFQTWEVFSIRSW